jgi:hypothetical protein
VFGDYDKMQGVAANVIVGQIPKSGTGDSDILLDEEIISKAMRNYVDDDDNDAEDDAQVANMMEFCGNVGIKFDMPLMKIIEDDDMDISIKIKSEK